MKKRLIEKYLTETQKFKNEIKLQLCFKSDFKKQKQKQKTIKIQKQLELKTKLASSKILDKLILRKIPIVVNQTF